jgi:hypothetical protein
MRSKTTASFRKAFTALPKQIQNQARELPAIQAGSLAFKLTFQAGTPEHSNLLGSCKQGLSCCRPESWERGRMVLDWLTRRL